MREGNSFLSLSDPIDSATIAAPRASPLSKGGWPRLPFRAESVVLMVRHRIDFRLNSCLTIVPRIGVPVGARKFSANDRAGAVPTGIDYVRRDLHIHSG